MKIHYILHADFETPRTIDEWAIERGHSTSLSRPFAGEPLPSADEFDTLIVMGGPQSPRNLKNAPYLVDEIALIKSSLKESKFILGFCLGAQLIGEALGGKTEKSPNKEVGIFPIQLNSLGMVDPIFQSIPDLFDVLHWHNDMPSLPEGAKVLAASEGCPRQVIRFGEKVLGFQCHPEATIFQVKEMITHCPEDLGFSTYTQTADDMLDRNFSAMRQIMHKILDNIFITQMPANSPLSIIPFGHL